MNPRSQKAAEFAADFLFGTGLDFVVKQAVRHGQSLEEVLEHASIEKSWKMITSVTEAAVQDEQVDNDAAKAAALVNLVPRESLAKLQLPEHATKLETVENAAETARKAVRSQIQTVDGSMSLQKLAKFMSTTDICRKLRGSSDSSILIIYNVESAGEHERDARRSPTPARKEHMEKLIRATLCTRGEVLPDFDDDKVMYPQMDPSDVWHGVSDTCAIAFLKTAVIDQFLHGICFVKLCICSI